MADRLVQIDTRFCGLRHAGCPDDAEYCACTRVACTGRHLCACGHAWSDDA